MDVDNWFEFLDWENYPDEGIVLRSLDDIDLEAEHHGDDRRIFRLEDFFVCDENDTRRLRPLDFDRLDNLCIAGKAIPIFPDDGDDGENNDGEDETSNTVFELNVRLSAIQKVEYTFLDVSTAGHDGIYVLTSFAWYLLQRPASFYRDLYKEPYRQFRLALTILRRAYDEPSEKLSSFVTRFRRLAARVDKKYTKALDYGYPELRAADLQQSSMTVARNIRFFIDNLKLQLENPFDNVHRSTVTDVHDRLAQSRVVDKVLKGSLATIRRREDNQIAAPSPPLPETREEVEIVDSSDEDMEDGQPAGRARPGCRTCVIPIVERAARLVFSHSFNLIGDRLPNVSWRESRSKGTPVAENVKMKRGQCIMVPAGIDEMLPHEDWLFNDPKTQSTNEAANEYWFAQVISTTQDGKRLHVRWFDHSSKTLLLTELERPMELFLTRRCNYIQRHHVKRTVEVRWFGPEQEAPNEERFYYIRFIRELDDSFTWASHADLQLDPSEPAKCSVCEKPTAGRIWFENNTLSIDGVALHRGDFVVTQPMNTSPWFAPGTYDVLQNRNSTPGQVFQVLSVLRSEEHGRDYLVAVALQPLERVNTLQAQGLVGPDHSSCPGRAEQDEKRLCLMDAWNCQLELDDFKRHPLRKCFVRHPDVFESVEDMNRWLGKSPVHFILDLRARPNQPQNPAGDQRPLNQPAASVEALSFDTFQELSRPCRRCQDETAAARVTKMRMLDLFCGAGGLTQGLVASGICTPKFAIDHDSAALETYSRNFQGATTIHQDVNVALSETLIAALKGLDQAPISEDEDDPKPLPSKYDIDFICAGPPCQSFSGANRFKKDNDPRTAMIAAVMSAVGHYRPRYFVIENVPNALTSRIPGPPVRAGSADSIESAENVNYIEQGVLRFIARTALDLGYAVRIGILQAAEYGTPQLRRRAFIIGARHGYTLPKFPLATHCVPHPDTGLRLPNKSYIDPIREKSGNAIHRQITMWDAIGDLAPFEWVNPHVVIRQTEATRAEDRRRRTRLHIPAYVAVHEDRATVGVGAHGAVPYREESPFTTYQQTARGDEVAVSEHYTSSFKSSVFVERVISIPISASADHRSLPEALRKDDFLSNIFGSGGASGYYRGAFGRYDKKSPFATILTSLRPAKKNGFCIHPEQKRMLSMRELARAQGFPDYFKFYGTVDQVNRQIGNAVVVQVAQAVGTEIKKAMLKDGVL